MKKKKWVLVFLPVILIPVVLVISVYLNFNIKKMKDSLNLRYSQVIFDSEDKIIRAYLNSEEQYQIEDKKEVPRSLEKAVIAYEDRDFYSHKGINILAICRAIKTNILTRRRVGGSTITMQVIKLYKKRDRTYINKLIEMIEAIKLERNLTKEEILEIYLNNAPYGGNIVGYRTASLMFFKKEPINLTWGEGALLAVLPNQPGLLWIEKNREKLLEKRNILLKTMYEEGIITKTQYRLSLLEGLPERRYYFENIAPHLSRRLRNLYSEQKEIHTTIDSDLQRRVEKKARDYGEHLATQGIKNLSCLIIDNKTGDVKAYIGSQNFFGENNGQVDGVIANRSVGSVLKPFLYALSIDDGIIVPESLVLDIPLYFTNFSPQNADKKYRGLVEISTALQKSLNIPFVNLLKEYGEDKFYYFLKNALKFRENNFERYGLSLILGTKEMSVEDMAKLYYGLANYGNFKDINYLKEHKKRKDNKLITPGSAYLTLQDLKSVVRAGDYNLYTGADNISWKTGTSYGKRDAWSCGVTPKWTVVVWVGNFTGQGNANLSGVRSAGNFLFNIFKILPDNSEFEVESNELKAIEVDNKTRYRVKYDVETREVLTSAKAKPLKYSPFYKKVFVDKKGNIIDSRDPNFYIAKEKVLLSYPTKLLNYLVNNKIDIGDMKVSSKIGIIYPLENLSIKVPRDFDGKKKVIVKIMNPKKEEIFWYVNGEYFGSTSETERSFDFEKGKKKISLISQSGSRAEVEFEIH